MLTLTINEQTGVLAHTPMEARSLDSIILLRANWKSSLYEILDAACADAMGDYNVGVHDPNPPMHYKSLTTPQACLELGVSAQAIFTCIATGGTAGFLVVLDRSIEKFLAWKLAREGRKISLKVDNTDVTLEGDHSIKAAKKLLKFALKQSQADAQDAH